MIDMSSTIVYGKVLSHVDQYGFINNFEVTNVLKGNLTAGQVIELKEYSEGNEEISTKIYGDVDFGINQEYLLFLFQDGDGYYKAHMLALSVYQNVKSNNTNLLAHPEQILDVCLVAPLNSELKEAYSKQTFLTTLKDVISGSSSWNSLKAGLYGMPKKEEHTHSVQAAGTPPSHCTVVVGNLGNLASTCSNNSPARYVNPTFTVKVASGYSSDPSTNTEIADLNNAIAELNNLSGISVSAASPIVQPCTTACGPNGVTDIVQSCNTSQANDIWVIFNDPCNQIGPLSGCTGTLGIGGTFAWNAPTCHSDGCGNLWRDALIPFFFMNDGAGCQGSYKYTAVLIHEMLHSVNIGHIAGTCTAIMNPSICNNTSLPNYGIKNLDRDCVEWMYDISNDPCNACSISNLQQPTAAVCNGATVDISIQFNVSNGSGNYNITLNGSNIGNVSGTSNGTVGPTILNTTIAAGTYTMVVIDSADPSCTASTSVTIPMCSAPCSISGLSITSTPSCIGTTVDIPIQFNVSGGSGTYTIALNGSGFTSIPGPVNGTVGPVVLNTVAAAGNYTLSVADNMDATCNDNVSINIPNCTVMPCNLNSNESSMTYGANTSIIVQNRITSSNTTVPNGINVLYDAGNFVQLNNGFTSNQNANFTIKTVGCP